MLDPQHRVLLECAVEAFEDAGYDPEKFPGRISVYAGVSAGSYLTANLASRADLIERVGAYQVDIGNHGEFVPTTISFKLNLKGPSINVQTACSTSLVAVHVACQSLLNGESDMALAGGGSITFPHKEGYLYQEEGIMSPDGHCRAFDAARARDGGRRGRGPRRAQAPRTMRAPTATPSTPSSRARPSTTTARSRSASRRRASTARPKSSPRRWRWPASRPRRSPTSRRTGRPRRSATPSRSRRSRKPSARGTQKRGFCAIGSLKTNIGHLDAGAGVAGLIKTVLALKHGEIPPSLHFEQPNPKIDFEKSPFFVNARSDAVGGGHGAAARGRELASASAGRTRTSSSKSRRPTRLPARRAPRNCSSCRPRRVRRLRRRPRTSANT